MKTRLLRAAPCTIAAFIISLFLYSITVCAETLEIVLPNLVGPYDVDGITFRQDTFQLNKLPINVDNVSIRLTGFHQRSMYCCDWAGDVCGPWPVWIYAVIPDVITPASWIAQSNAPSDPAYNGTGYPYPPSYEFEITLTFFSTSGATWDFLSTLEGTMSLNCKPILYNDLHCWTYWDEPYVDITEVVLVIEAEFSVAVEESSWGAIKALYSQ